MGLKIDSVEIDNLTSDPVSPVEGQLWYNTTEKKLKIQCNGTAEMYGGKFNQATADPTATDDSAAGYTVGSRWINTTTGREFICVDATATAAVWRRCSFVFGTGAGTVTEGNDSRLSDARTPTTHAFAGAEHSASTLSQVNAKISDATLIDTADSRLSDARTPTSHAFAGAEHSSSTLANVNSKISSLIPTYGGIRDIGVGTLAQRPTAGTANRFFWTTDEQKLYRDTGSTWNAVVATAASQPPEYVESETESTTQSTSYVQKVRLTTSSLPSGLYLISYNGEIGSDSNTQATVKVELDDTTIISEPIVSPGGTDYFPLGGMRRVNLTAGVHTVDMDFKSSSGTKTVKIRRCRIFLQRVG